MQNHFLALYLEQQPERTYTGEVVSINKDGKPVVLLQELGIERACEAEVPVSAGERHALKPQVDVLGGTVTWVMAAGGKGRARQDGDEI